MRKIILLACLLVGTCKVIAQVGKTEKADKHYGSYSYASAIEKFEGVEEKSPAVNRKLAESYWKLHNYEKAEEYYSKLVNQPDAEPLDYYNYAESLRSNAKYQEAEEMMHQYHGLIGYDTRAIRHVQNKGYTEHLLKNNGQYLITNLEINSHEQDFGATYYKDKVVFTSSREGTTPIQRKWNWNGLPFLDMYVADKATDGSLSNYKEFHKKLNLKYHEGPASFSENGDLVVFTRNNYKGTDAKGIVKLQLYYAEIKNDDWEEEQSVHFNNDQYSVGHPALSPDGKTMYFTSDMPGGLGGTDIYKVKRKEDGSWGQPENLGNKINTEGNEMFPFYHKDNLLVFASNGHLGLGGLDNYITPIKEDESFGKIVNLGTPINTNSDDFSLVLNKEMTQGYFASNRTGGHGDDDIYGFELLTPFKFGKTIKGIAKDKDNNILDNTLVTLTNVNGVSIDTIKTDSSGRYSFYVDAEQDFQLSGFKPQYFDGKNTASTKTTEDVIIADLILEKDPGLSLYMLITDKKTNLPIEGVLVQLTDNFTGETIDIITKSTGDYLKPLLKNRLKDRISYNLTFQKEGYFSKALTYNDELLKPGQYNIHKSLDLSMDPEVDDLAELVDINPINFDLNKYNIRPDAAIELDKIVAIMSKYDKMVVELGAHTDCRGSSAYNERLSDKRAKASAAYIKTKITNPDRIYGKGYGETKLLNDCACEGKVKSNCEEERHSENRRTEFKVISTGSDNVNIKNNSTESF